MQSGFSFRGKRLVQKHQVFLTSGTFYPSKGLLEAGGVVDVYVLGGGGSGAVYSTSGGGGSAGQSLNDRVAVSGPVTVVIGAGGAGSTGASNAGGTSSFGPAIAANGGSGGGYGNGGGAGAGGSGPVMGGATGRASNYYMRALAYNSSTTPGEAGGPPDAHGNGYGGNATSGGAGRAGRGDGGAGVPSGTSYAGGSGRVEVTWWEYAQ